MPATKKKVTKYDGENVRVDPDIKAKVTEYINNNGGKLGAFYDTAALEKLKSDNAITHLKRLIERIEEANVQNEFLSAYQRAKDFVNNS